MSEMPDDIAYASQNVLSDGPEFMLPDDGVNEDALVLAIGRAILAERERCAKIAESDVSQDCGWGPGAIIAEVIRGDAKMSACDTVAKADAWDAMNAAYRRGMEHGLAMVPRWERIVDGQEPSGLVIVAVALFSTGERLGYDLAYFEDGDWNYNMSDGDINSNVYPTHWCRLIDLPEA